MANQIAVCPFLVGTKNILVLIFANHMTLTIFEEIIFFQQIPGEWSEFYKRKNLIWWFPVVFFFLLGPRNSDIVT